MGRLQGKVAIITGAGRGIGRTMARRFAEEGAKIAVTSFTPANVDALVAELNESHGRGTALGMRCDVGEEADSKNAVASTVAAFGTIELTGNHALKLSPAARTHPRHPPLH